jgi:hypothetical protein
VTFEDKGAAAPNMGLAAAPPPSSSLAVTDDTLKDFLARPVTLATVTWASTDAAETVVSEMNPWKLYLANTAVKNKVANYQVIRGNLHLRIMLNGSPFHYGLLCGWYHPYAYNCPGSTHARVCTFIQHPHVLIQPAETTSADIVLPFVSLNEWIDLSPTGYSGNLDEAKGVNLGSFSLSVVTPLVDANTLGATDIDLTVMAWLEQVEIGVPTPFPQLEAGQSVKVKRKTRKPRNDEYKADGLVSSIASTVADVAGRLTDVPGLATLARATEVGADAVGAIAALFGWSKPTLISMPLFVKPKPFAYLSQYEGADLSNKLALDVRAETPVGPGSIGLPNKDSLVINDILQRPSYINTVTWATTDATGTRVARIPVTPGLVGVTAAGANYQTVNMTPMFWLTRVFMYWTGTIRYNFKFIATRFHRGRVRICYFPRDALITPAVDYTNTSWNTVVDVTDDMEIEIEVPYTQKVPWMRSRMLTTGSTDNYSFANGELAIYVLNELKSPTGTGSIQVFVTATAGDDFRVAKPYADEIQNFTFLNSEGATWDTDKPTQLGTGVKTVSSNEWTTGPAPVLESGDGMSRQVVDNRDYPVRHFGESIVSLRTLLKRATPYITGNVDVASAISTASALVLPYLPFDHLAEDLSTDYPLKVFGAAGTQATGVFAAQTFISYLKQPFLAARGSVRYKAVLWDSVERPGFANEKDLRGVVAASLTDAVAPCAYVTEVNNIAWEGASGMSLDTILTQDGVEVEVPAYFNRNFTLAGTINDMTLGIDESFADLSSQNSVVLYLSNVYNLKDAATADFKTTTYYVTASGGDDFTLDWFVAVPLARQYIGTYGRRNVQPPA